MATKSTYSEDKKVYCAAADNQQRGFYAYLRRLQKDAAAAEADASAEAAKIAADEAAKAAKAAADAAKAAAKLLKKKADEAAKAKAAAADEAKAKADADAAAAAKAAKAAAEAAAKAKAESAKDAIKAEAIKGLRAVMIKKGLKAADFSKDYLIENLPLRFNAANELCSIKRIEDEDAAEAREKFASMLVERDGKLLKYTPIRFFTANSLLSVFTAAADAKSKAAKAAAAKESAAERQAKAEAKAAARYAEALRRVKEYEAQHKAESAAN